MGHITGKNVAIAILDANAASQFITGDSNSVTLTWTNDIIELRPFQATALEKVEGVPDWGWDIAGYYNTAASKADEILGTLSGCVSSSTAASICFAGSVSGCPHYVGNCILADYAVSAAADGAGTFTATFAGSGGLTRSAIT